MIEAPLNLYTGAVQSEWIDYNGHMNDAEYMRVFSVTIDAFLIYLDFGAAYVKRANCGIYTVEGHLNYLRELNEGDALRCTTHLLGFDARRFHIFHHLYHAGQNYLAATSEFMMLHVNLQQQQVVPMPGQAVTLLEQIYAAHAQLPRPAQAGRSVRM